MPSPVGHALGGIAAGWAVTGRPRGRAVRRDALLFGVLGIAPDLDLLFNAHSGPTHGVGAAILTALAVWVWAALTRRAHGGRLALASAAAYASHTLLDWLGTDTSAPIGIMALWPLTGDYYQSDLHVFLAVSRRVSQADLFWIPNLRALIRELLILLPALTIVSFVRRRPEPSS